MKSSTKKIIAREYIFILSLVAITGLVFLYFFTFSQIKSHKINQKKEERQKLISQLRIIDSLQIGTKKPYRVIVLENIHYLRSSNVNINISESKFIEEPIVPDSIIKQIYKVFKQNFGESFTKPYPEFVLKIQSSFKESKNYTQTDKEKIENSINVIGDEIYSLQNDKFNHEVFAQNFIFKIFIALIALLFGLRYLIILIKYFIRSIKWAMRESKNNTKS